MEGFELPRAVVGIVKIIANLCGDSTNLGYGFRRLYAAAQGARINSARLPATGNAICDGGGLGASLIGKFERFAAAKSLRLDAFDVPMTDQENFRHAFGSKTMNGSPNSRGLARAPRRLGNYLQV